MDTNSSTATDCTDAEIINTDDQVHDDESQIRLGLRSRLKFYFGLFALWAVSIFLHTLEVSDIANWVARWSSWDAEWYQKIWLNGYAADPRTLVFPPGYSMLIGSLHTLTGLSFGWTALLVNLVAFSTGSIALTEMVRDRYRIDHRPFYIFLLAGPTLYYTFMVYSDAVFFCLLSLALLLAHQQEQKRDKTKSILLGGLLLIMPWTRITGYALFSWILARRWSAGLVLISLAGWLALNKSITGDALHFIHAQEAFTMPPGNFFDGFLRAWEPLQNFPANSTDRHLWFQTNMLPLLSLLLLSCTAIWFVIRRDRLIALTILSIMLMSRNQSFWRSVLRYDMPIYPFVAVPILFYAEKVKDPLPYLAKFLWLKLTVLILISYWLQLFYARIAHQGGWTF